MSHKGQVESVGFMSKTVCFVLGKIFDLSLSRFPNTVQIETTNGCNSKCIICPHSTMDRPITTMGDDLFKKVIDECVKFKCGNVHLHNFGEPFLDRNIIERIKYAKASGLAKVKIFSNGSLITEKLVVQIIESGLDEIKISFDGANKEEFEKIRYPLKFNVVVNNIKNLVAMRDKMQSPLKIKVSCSSTSDKSETMVSLENCVDDFSFGKLHNWGDSEISSSEKSKKRKPCSRVWRTFTVLADGKVSLCCLDYEGKVVLGDVNTASIAEIWKNEAYRLQRKIHTRARQHKISICSNCSKSLI
ncbi:MAG: radical SAM/SPASM domain-containing protein [Desulfobulbaceae bacterium]|jgi:radical SAM protein with 4Fe4S-binding SPASM domain|nr:radical SAM/SPASM domain-containing protein [Desulfobulbaceae bacterium]